MAKGEGSALPWTVLLACFVIAARCFTLPEDTAKLLALKEQLSARGPNWRDAFKTWTCPDYNDLSSCDPCGEKQWWGKWDYIGCRGDAPKRQDILGGDGHVTNIHFTEFNGEGPDLPVKQLCVFNHTKELDITGGGGGTMGGAIPPEVASCFPHLDAIKFSFNQLTGTIPRFLSNISTLAYFKVRANKLVGSIPSELAQLPDIYFLDLADNQLTGTLPSSLRNAAVLGEIQVSNNKLQGDLYSLAGLNLVLADVYGNAGLCGMVPASVRWAHGGWNTTGTQLGQPCPGATYPPVL